ncbi:hypothetical protein LR48_Vigan03g150800 [Vigna angularis]|uniref:Uncharacterized protein n=2 Tax=Phaseolus angularis TaxID=3914 RepID=A0A0L9U5S8_PHAAN|nr:hypothetical protein LR48_Vigan03g150800 [Vigna angularis]BAT84549.1 hypothetical protein VIGAN_04195800 [Vigna angularis var. angularis]
MAASNNFFHSPPLLTCEARRQQQRVVSEWKNQKNVCAQVSRRKKEHTMLQHGQGECTWLRLEGVSGGGPAGGRRRVEQVHLRRGGRLFGSEFWSGEP